MSRWQSIYGRARQFDPRRIAGIGAWYDASVASSITIQTGVQQWADLSGNGRHLVQNTTNNQPVYATNLLNGLPAVQFDKVNDRLVWASAGALQQPLTIFTVHRLGATVSVSNETVYDSATNGNRMRMYYGNSGQFGITANGSNVLATASINQFPDTEFGVSEAIFNGSSSFVARNGALSNTGNAGTATSDGIALNAFGGFAAFGGAWIAEFILYSRSLGATERRAIRQYLGRKYAIAVTA